MKYVDGLIEAPKNRVVEAYVNSLEEHVGVYNFQG